MIFKKDSCVINLTRDPFEPEELFIERGYFVVSQKPKSKQEFNYAILYSRIYINYNFKNCNYTDYIIMELNKMIKNLFN